MPEGPGLFIGLTPSHMKMFSVQVIIVNSVLYPAHKLREASDRPRLSNRRTLLKQ